jgi:hypothetical protein
MQPLVHRLLQQPTQLIAQVDTLAYHVDKCCGVDGGEMGVSLLCWRRATWYGLMCYHPNAIVL